MSVRDRSDPGFHVTYRGEASEALLVGLSGFGLAGLTAVDYLVDRRPFEQSGHLTAEGLPTITPFQNGTPRHHTRLFDGEDDFGVLIGELFVPVWAAASFSDAILDWARDHAVEEVTILAGIPVAHGPDDHRTFYVATEDYRGIRLEGTDVPGMAMGFLDGVNASLVERGIESDLAVGVLVTPVHAQTPDVDAALRLLSTVESLYGVEIDIEPLEAFAEEVRQHYAQLSERLAAAPDRDVPEDRMYM